MLTRPAGNELTLVDHLAELKKRLTRCLIAVAAGSILGLAFAKKIFATLASPLDKILGPQGAFLATSPFESFSTYLRVALLTGFFLSLPVIFYQLWRFISPGLKTEEKKWIVPFTVASTLLFVGGSLFGYFVIFPTGFFYASKLLEGTGIILMPRMANYLGLATTLLVAFGIIFELPLFIFLLGRIGLLDVAKIGRYRRYVIVAIVGLAAVLTPGPDIISQCLMALPLWILYELGGLLLWFTERSGTRQVDSSCS